MNKYTPGPWGVTSRNWSFRIQPQSNDPAENEANMRLIRLAPELLEALEALLADAVEIQALRQSIHQRNGTPFTPSAKIEQARATIRKARGE